ncbi:MAG: hypothetical protein AAGA03_00370, partial [Planctomycetota bacterium]
VVRQDGLSRWTIVAWSGQVRELSTRTYLGWIAKNSVSSMLLCQESDPKLQLPPQQVVLRSSGLASEEDKDE